MMTRSVNIYVLLAIITFVVEFAISDGNEKLWIDYSLRVTSLGCWIGLGYLAWRAKDKVTHVNREYALKGIFAIVVSLAIFGLLSGYYLQTPFVVVATHWYRYHSWLLGSIYLSVFTFLLFLSVLMLKRVLIGRVK